MKTAISLPDGLFKAAERLARRLRVSRSELYQRALAEYLARHDEAVVTEQLDRVYGPGQDNGVDPVLDRIQWASLAREEW